MGVDSNLVGVYFSWLVAVGFLDKPKRKVGESQIKEDGDGEIDGESKDLVAELPALKQGGAVKAIGRGSAH